MYTCVSLLMLMLKYPLTVSIIEIITEKKYKTCSICALKENKNVKLVRSGPLL